MTVPLTSPVEFLKLIGNHLTSIVLCDLKTSMDSIILADESTVDGNHSQLAIFVCTIRNNPRPIEYFPDIVHICISKTAAVIMDIISTFLNSEKNITILHMILWFRQNLFYE